MHFHLRRYHLNRYQNILYNKVDRNPYIKMQCQFINFRYFRTFEIRNNNYDRATTLFLSFNQNFSDKSIHFCSLKLKKINKLILAHYNMFQRMTQDGLGHSEKSIVWDDSIWRSSQFVVSDIKYIRYFF